MKSKLLSKKAVLILVSVALAVIVAGAFVCGFLGFAKDSGKKDAVSIQVSGYLAQGDLRDPLVIGGGTYAKKMKHFVAFGPEHPEMPNLAHQADECIESKYLLFLAKLYARAIYALAR